MVDYSDEDSDEDEPASEGKPKSEVTLSTSPKPNEVVSETSATSDEPKATLEVIAASATTEVTEAVGGQKA